MTGGLSQRFEIEAVVAKSRMAVVRRVYDHRLERRVALKQPRRDRADAPLIASLFRHEQRMAQALRHPHIPRALETGTSEGQPYIAFEYVEGTRLVDLLTRASKSRRSLSMELVWKIARGVASALAFLHHPPIQAGFAGAVHMDVCPHNILVDSSGEPLLIDFGISRSDWLPPEVPVVLGREAYLAPEIFRGSLPTPALDVFALGALLHETLLSRPLFRAARREETFRRIQSAPIPVPHLERSSCPVGLGSVVLRALTRHPRHRFVDGSEIWAALSKDP